MQVRIHHSWSLVIHKSQISLVVIDALSVLFIAALMQRFKCLLSILRITSLLTKWDNIWHHVINRFVVIS